MFSPGYADTDSFKEFLAAVQAQEEESGRAQISVETGTCIIIIFGLKDVMKRMKFDKIKDTYEIKAVKKIEPLMEIFQTPEERLQEAIAIYEDGQQTE
jgi:hypothetical protein